MAQGIKGSSKPCSIKGCNKVSAARGYCKAHWWRWRNGKPMSPPVYGRDRRADFWRQVRKTKTCWIWTGTIKDSGYGTFRWNGRDQYVHRLAYTWLVGTIPRGLEIDHVRKRGCRSRACCNPTHLEPVTPAENKRRARRTVCKRGHRMTKTNTYYRKDNGARQCIKCIRLRYQMKKEALIT